MFGLEDNADLDRRIAKVILDARLRVEAAVIAKLSVEHRGEVTFEDMRTFVYQAKDIGRVFEDVAEHMVKEQT